MNFEVYDNKIIAKQNQTYVGEVFFNKVNNNHYNIIKVYVLEEFRGNGIALQLMEELVKHAKQNNLKLTPICSYAVHFFNKNPQYADLLNYEK